MVKARRGSVILVGSTPALTGDTVGIPYLVAKGGVLALARALAQVYGPHGVRVNAEIGRASCRERWGSWDGGWLGDGESRGELVGDGCVGSSSVGQWGYR